ncbi:hypothetical protein [Micromonospora sp. DT31]|uniref:hypothetical protein n=1 Tax=Micromonospora sp. DT31 TaxID=3393434 RepID=UPI003CF666A3
MVNLPAARRHHRSRVGYAVGLLLFLVVATALALVVRHPAFSATQQLAEPVPAPEITVVDGDPRSADEPADEGEPADDDDEDGWAANGAAEITPPPQGGTGAGTVADRPTDTDGLSRSLFYSGLLGLAISLAGLGLVGIRRRQW